MVLQNYVILESGVPATLRFYDHRIEKRTVTDPITAQPVSRNVLVFEVNRLGAAPVAAKYSIMAEKHAQQFAAFLPDKSYVNYEFTITKYGEGFTTTWSVQATKIK